MHYNDANIDETSRCESVLRYHGNACMLSYDAVNEQLTVITVDTWTTAESRPVARVYLISTATKVSVLIEASRLIGV